MMNIDAIKQIDWYADWSGPFPLLEVSIAPKIYFAGLQSHFGQSLSHFLVLYRDGIGSARLPYDEVKALGKYLADRTRDPSFTKKWAAGFKEAADKITPELRRPPSEFLEKLRPLDDLYQNYGAYNVATKIVFDYLSKDAQEVRAKLEDARKYSETFYKENAEMFSHIADLLSQQIGCPKHLILMMTREELYAYQSGGQLPSENTLRQRYEYSGMHFDKQRMDILSRKEVEDLESFWSGVAKKEGLKGTVAYPGKVKGICRVVFDYRNADINEGEILVTGMTDPNFVPLMRKVSAIVTDGGGLLSHAAIVARELKKPCIVGTKVATQVLHDGDEVELDADTGVVRVLRQL